MKFWLPASCPPPPPCRHGGNSGVVLDRLVARSDAPQPKRDGDGDGDGGKLERAECHGTRRSG